MCRIRDRPAALMNLATLEVFCMVASTGRISYAAKLLHLSQPAVTNQIRQLEDTLGVQLLNRHNRGVTLTEAGEILQDHARRMLEVKSSLENSIYRLANSGDPELVIAAAPIVATYILPCTTWTFRAAYPEARVRVELDGSVAVLERVLKADVDLGVIDGHYSCPGLVLEELGREPLVVIGPPGGLLAGRKQVAAAELQRFPLLIQEPSSAVREAFLDTIEKAGISIESLTIVDEIYSLDTLRDGVAAGLGLAIVPRMTILRDARDGKLEMSTVDGLPLSMGFNLAYREGQRSDLCRRFMRLLRQPALGLSALCATSPEVDPVRQ